MKAKEMYNKLSDKEKIERLELVAQYYLAVLDVKSTEYALQSDLTINYDLISSVLKSKE